LQAVPDLLHLLTSGDAALQEQACWAIGNIAGDSDEFRAALIGNGALAPLLAFLATAAAAAAAAATTTPQVVVVQQNSPTTCSQTAAWAVSNLSRGSTSATHFAASGFMSLLIALTSHSDPVVATEMWWLFYYLSGKENEAVNCMFQFGMADAMTSAVNNACPTDINVVPIMRTLGNLTSGAVEWTSELLDRPGLLATLAKLLSSPLTHKSVLKEILWVVGNIFGSTAVHRASALASGLLHLVFTSLMMDQCDMQREAVFAIFNASSDAYAILVLCQHGGKPVLQQLVRLLRTLDSDVAFSCLQILRRVALDSPPDWKTQIVEIYNEADLYDALEELQYGSCPVEVRQAARSLIDDVLEDEDGIDAGDAEFSPSVFSSALLGGVGVGVEGGGGVGGGSGGMGRGRHLSQPSWMR